MEKPNFLVIDGQGGRVGKQLIEGIRQAGIDAFITAVGTNCTATATMLKAGADAGATGENAVKVNCRCADIIVGPIGIVIADSLYGEITPSMAVDVGQSRAVKYLIPINQCSNIVVGIENLSTGTLINNFIQRIKMVYLDKK